MSGWSDGAQLLRDLEQIAGRAVVDRFLSFVGGTRIYIPREKPDHEAGRLIEAFGGLEHATAIIKKLAPQYGGLNLDIPLGGSGFHERRREAIAEVLLRGNASVAQVANLFGITERTIHNHKRRLRDMGRLPPLPHQPDRQTSPETVDLVRIDLLTHPQPDQRSNDEIAHTHRCSREIVINIRSRLIKVGRIPPLSTVGPHG